MLSSVLAFLFCSGSLLAFLALLCHDTFRYSTASLKIAGAVPALYIAYMILMHQANLWLK